MRNLITTLFPLSIISLPETNPNPTRTLILPKPISSITSSRSQTEMMINNCNESNQSSVRRTSQINQHEKSHEMKQQAHCTPIIELQPILTGSSMITQRNEIRKNINPEVNDVSNHPMIYLIVCFS